MLSRLLAMKPRDVPWSVAVRNTLAVAIPLALGVLGGHAGAGIAVAIGALNTMFADQPGPYRLRAQRMLLTALGAGVSAFAGATFGAWAPLIVVAALVWGVAGGMLVAIGPEAGRAGMTWMILLVVMSADPLPLTDAAGIAVLVFSGGVLQSTLALAAWPLQRYRPERDALAEVFRQLAAMARMRHDPTTPPPTTQAVQFAQYLLHGEHRSRSLAVQSFRVLAEISERARIELLALGDLRENVADPRSGGAIGDLLLVAARVLDGIASALAQAAPPTAAQDVVESLDPLVDVISRLRAEHADRSERRLLRIAHTRGEGLAGQLRSAVRNAAFAGSRGEAGALAVEAHLPAALRPQGALATLRANLTLSSVAFRHALRCGVCLALAVATERALALPHGFWIPMTTAIVLKPDFAGTFSFGVLRVAGTLAGLLLVSALLHVAFAGTWDRLLVFAVLCLAFRVLTSMNYGLGTAALTGMIVVLMSFHGDAPGETMLPRALYTLAGSALALTAYALWPTWERQRLRPTLAAMIDAYRAYLAAVFDGGEQAWADTRSVARAARTNALASLDRLAGEPRPDRRLIALAEGVFANGNRLARATMALEAARIDGGEWPRSRQVSLFAARADAALRALVTSLREGTPSAYVAPRPAERALAAVLETIPADDPQRAIASALAHACDRITDAIGTLAHGLDAGGRA
jgi:uncharacterized membrane protein YccC